MKIYMNNFTINFAIKLNLDLTEKESIRSIIYDCLEAIATLTVKYMVLLSTAFINHETA